MKLHLKVAAGLAVALGLTACSSAGGAGADGETIHIVGFAVPEAANKAIATEFNKTDEGKDVSFQTSYGASAAGRSDAEATRTRADGDRQTRDASATASGEMSNPSTRPAPARTSIADP